MKGYLIITLNLLLIHSIIGNGIDTYISGANKNFTQSTPTTKTFTGTIRYKDNINNHKPVKYAMVKIKVISFVTKHRFISFIIS